MMTRCSGCYGSGQVMGGGMISKIECPQCHGTGKPNQDKIDFDKAKQTKSYQTAKKRLQKNSDISDQEAEKILDEELKREIK